MLQPEEVAASSLFELVPLVHIPLAITRSQHAAETAGVFEALAISGGLLLVASFRE